MVRLHSLPMLLLIAWLLAGWSPLAAQSIELYEGEAAVGDQSEAARLAALPAALADALIKLSGDASIAADAELQPELAQASALMQQYRYRQEAETVAGQPQLRQWLLARFDKRGVDRLLRASGRSAWPTPRPSPVVWLAIDDGRGPRLLASAQAQVVAALTRRGERRGLRLTYPLLDLEEQREVALATFWAGDSAAARRASVRYQSRVALVGKLYRSPSGWTAEWRVYDGEQLLGESTPSSVDAAELLALGADLAADLLAARAKESALSAGPPGRFEVLVDGIHSGEDYARLMAYLQQLSVVRKLSPRQADGGQLLLELELRSGLGGLQRLVESGSVLAVGEAARGEPARFHLLP